MNVDINTPNPRPPFEYRVYTHGWVSRLWSLCFKWHKETMYTSFSIEVIRPGMKLVGGRKKW